MIDLARAFRAWTSVAAFALVTASCGSLLGGDDRPRVTLTPTAASAPAGAMTTLHAEDPVVIADSYEGTIGGAPVSFGRVDDTTLVAVIPGFTAPGSVQVQVDLDKASGRGQLTVTTPVAIADPAGVIESLLAGADAALDAATAPTTYSGAWSSDSAIAARAVAAARAAFAQLTPAEQLDAARFITSLDLDTSGPAGRLSSVASGLTAPRDLACADKLIGWDTHMSNGNKAAAAAAGASSSSFRWVSAYAIAITSYIKSVLAWGGVGNLCTMEQDLGLVEGPTPDDRGTEVTITADHRSFIDGDAATSAIAARVESAKGRMARLTDAAVALASKVSQALSRPTPPPEGVVVEQDVPVEPERVELTTTTVPDSDGSPVGIRLVRSAGKLIVEATAPLLAERKHALTFRVNRDGHLPKQEVRNVTVQSVCNERNVFATLFAQCVHRIVIEPSSLEMGVGLTRTLTAAVYSADGTLISRTVEWRSDDPSRVVVTPSGYVQGTEAVGPVMIRAFAGSGKDERTASIPVTIVDIDSTSIYEQAVLGNWTIKSLDPNSTHPGYPALLRADKKIAYSVPLDQWGMCPGHGGTRVGDHCEWYASWWIARQAGRYYLVDSGFWNWATAQETREPLSMPVTSFITYSPYDATVKARQFIR